MKKATVKLPHENLAELWPKELYGANIGAVVHPASVHPATLEHIVSAVLAKPNQPWTLKALFGPQHGILGHTQDNMIEWEGSDSSASSLPIYSLYGKERKPTCKMLQGLNALVIDLQDVGSRYYTFIWTMVLCLEAAAEAGIAVVILDRPNPINGVDVEGPILQHGFESFVGYHSGLTIRHGMTIGEIAKMAQNERPALKNLKLFVLKMVGWKREMMFDQTGLPWVLPSPNMPTLETAVVYPGQCLLEATTISEGRGTTKPFEIIGSEWCNAAILKHDLDSLKLPGVLFRELGYEPTFHKGKGHVCAGVQIHVIDRTVFKPVLTGFAVIWALRKQAPTISKVPVSFDPNLQMPAGVFGFKAPPYEYVYDVQPFDILAGSSKWRELVDDGTNPWEIAKQWESAEKEWLKHREQYLLY